MTRALVVALILFLGACQSLDIRQKRANGAMVGSALGALIGGLTFGSGSARIVFATLGAGIGAVGGYYAAEHLDRWQKERMERAAYDALAHRADGEAVAWGDATAGPHGSVSATRTLTGPRGRHCREYEIVVHAEEAVHTEARLACRLETGAWELGLGPDRAA